MKTTIRTSIALCFIALLLTANAFAQGNGNGNNGNGNGNGGSNGNNGNAYAYGRNKKKSTNPMATQRLVTLHGWSANRFWWNEHRNALAQVFKFPNDNTPATGNLDYSSGDNNGVVASRDTAQQNTGYLKSNNKIERMNIGIGHSKGGTVLRDWHLNDPDETFDALITLGAPLDGAYGFNSINNGDALAFKGLSGAVLVGAFGLTTITAKTSTTTQWVPAAVWAADVAIVDIAVSYFAFPHIVNSVADIYHQMIFNSPLDADPSSSNKGVDNSEKTQTTRDLAVGSEYINSIKTKQLANPNNTPIFCIYGKEDAPAHYRTLASNFSFYGSDEGYKVFSAVPFGLATVGVALHTVGAIIEFNQTNAFAGSAHILAAAAWVGCACYFDGQFGEIWRGLNTGNFGNTDYDGIVAHSSAVGTETKTRLWEEKLNADIAAGVVKGAPPRWTQRRLDGVNHIEMKTSKEAEKAIKDVLYGNTFSPIQFELKSGLVKETPLPPQTF